MAILEQDQRDKLERDFRTHFQGNISPQEFESAIAMLRADTGPYQASGSAIPFAVGIRISLQSSFIGQFSGTIFPIGLNGGPLTGVIYTTDVSALSTQTTGVYIAALLTETVLLFVGGGTSLGWFAGNTLGGVFSFGGGPGGWSDGSDSSK